MSAVIVELCVAAALLSALVHLFAEYRGPHRLVYVAKPLTTSLLAVAAAISPASSPRVQTFIVIGLLCSLAGDVFLMLPRDRFVAGLLSFLLAHAAYIAAFSSGVRFAARPWLFLPYAVAAAAIVAILWPRLGRLRLPVLLYVAALVAMAGQAASRGEPLAAIGAALFVASDATLAVNRFRVRFRAAQAIVMSTYVAAQVLIALSASR